MLPRDTHISLSTFPETAIFRVPHYLHPRLKLLLSRLLLCLQLASSSVVHRPLQQMRIDRRVAVAGPFDLLFPALHCCTSALLPAVEKQQTWCGSPALSSVSPGRAQTPEFPIACCVADRRPTAKNAGALA